MPCLCFLRALLFENKKLLFSYWNFFVKKDFPNKTPRLYMKISRSVIY